MMLWTEKYQWKDGDEKEERRLRDRVAQIFVAAAPLLRHAVFLLFRVTTETKRSGLLKEFVKPGVLIAAIVVNVGTPASYRRSIQEFDAPQIDGLAVLWLELYG